MDLLADLPTETDRRLWQHLAQEKVDSAAAKTLYRLQVLDQTDIYQPLPAELMLELAHRFCLTNFRPASRHLAGSGTTMFTIDSKLDVILTGGANRSGLASSAGEMFGEITFFC
jgi:hypothetical protein